MFLAGIQGRESTGEDVKMSIDVINVLEKLKVIFKVKHSTLDSSFRWNDRVGQE